MVEKLIGEIEAKIRAEGISESVKNELLQSLAKLKVELAGVTKTSDVTREKKTSLIKSVEDLRSSVAGFEQSHPKLVETINNISSTLSNLGV